MSLRFGLDRLGDAARLRVVAGQRRVARGEERIGDGHPELDVVDHGAQELPRSVRIGQVTATVGMRLGVGGQGGPDPVPGGQVDPALRPGEDPRDRAQPVKRGARGGAAAGRA